MNRYTEKVFPEAAITPDIIYTTAPGYDERHIETPLDMDIYSPAGDREKSRRAIIFCMAAASATAISARDISSPPAN